MMGLKNAGVIVANPETLVSIGHLTSHSVLLGILGFFIIAILASRNIHAAVWCLLWLPPYWAGCWAMCTTPASSPRRRA